jgi:hypothetical protein
LVGAVVCGTGVGRAGVVVLAGAPSAGMIHRLRLRGVTAVKRIHFPSGV